MADNGGSNVGSPETWQDIDVCTLGMFIIDEIHFNNKEPLSNDYSRQFTASAPYVAGQTLEQSKDSMHPKPTDATTKVLHNIMGGAGSYTALGARIFLTSANSKRVGWIVDMGSDFPTPMRTQIASWGTSCLFRPTPDRLTTRGWNGYGDGTSEQRAFRYLTPKLRLDEGSLTPELLLSRGFHMICSPQRCVSMVRGVLGKRNELLAGLLEMGGSVRDRWRDRPVIVWEPVPDVCSAEEWENCKRAIRVVDCISPNHVELAAFFGDGAEVENADGSVRRDKVEDLAGKLIGVGIGPGGKGSVVVRAGREGCCVVAPGLERPVWLPAHHQPGTGKVIDPTGGGNTFLGGLTAALTNGCPVTVAAAVGSVVAGVAIEQIGMPELDADRDTWNGMSFAARANIYQGSLEQGASGVRLDTLALQPV